METANLIGNQDFCELVLSMPHILICDLPCDIVPLKSGKVMPL